MEPRHAPLFFVALVTGLAALVGLWVTPIAVLDGRHIASGSACPTGEDVVAAEQLDHQWLRPRVQCRDEGYFSPSPSVPRWETRDSLLIAPGALVVTALGALLVPWAVRRAAGRSVTQVVRPPPPAR